MPLTETRYCVLGVDLVALRRETPWGVRVEYVDLTLKRPVYACYTPAFSQRPR